MSHQPVSTPLDEDELAALLVALETHLGVAPVTSEAPSDDTPAWRFSGRWWR